MSKMLEMHTNLMRPATVQSAFEQARAASTAHNFKIRSRFSPTFACDRHFLAMNSMTRDCGHNCSGTATQLPRDEREVNWLNRWFHHGNAVTRVNDVACARRTAIYRHETLPDKGLNSRARKLGSGVCEKPIQAGARIRCFNDKLAAVFLCH